MHARYLAFVGKMMGSDLDHRKHALPVELRKSLWPACESHDACAGDIVAVGDGKIGETIQTFDLSVGQTILYSKFGIGATDITVQGGLHVLIREDDVIGILPRSGATAADVPDLKPAADRILIKVLFCLASCAHPLATCN